MAKQRNDEKEIDILTENWISLNEKEDPDAFSAWVAWRKQQMGCNNHGKNLTVPAPYPPSSVSAAKEYIAIVQQIRKAVGWTSMKAKLKTDVSAWMGEL